MRAGSLQIRMEAVRALSASQWSKGAVGVVVGAGAFSLGAQLGARLKLELEICDQERRCQRWQEEAHGGRGQER